MVGKAGRPVGESDARARLIAEARKLFVALPYSKVSTRMIASRAGVNVAMIRYYFGNKAGLFENMLRETLEPIHNQLEVVLSKGDIESLGDLMRTYYRIMAPNPDLPKLMIRTMMMEPGDIQRQAFEKVFNEFAIPASEMIFQLFKKEGKLRRDICPEKARMTFISMLIFPFLIPLSLLEIQGMEINETYLMELAEHNIKVLMQGIMAD